MTTVEPTDPAPEPATGHAPAPAPNDPSSAPGAGIVGRRRRVTLSDPLRRAIITVLVLGALAGIFFTGRAAVTGTEVNSGNLPDSVDRLIPGSGQQVLRQTQVGIDLADGYDAYLQINGVDVRTTTDGLIKDLGTGLVLFQPGEGTPVDELNSGQNCVIAFVWRPPDPASTATPVSWCFTAT